MTKGLINGQHLAEDFLAILPASGTAKPVVMTPAGRTGEADLQTVPESILAKLPLIFRPNCITGYERQELFNGDISRHGGDHSSADLALCAHMANEGLRPDEVDLVFRASGLYRPKWDEMHGATTYGQRTLAKAFEGFPAQAINGGTAQNPLGWWDPSGLARFRPNYVAGGMAARQFVGPNITPDIRLFSAAALSALVALGGVGKTSLLMSVAAHVAAGKSWGGFCVAQTKVAMFFCEETQNELDRKISAVIDGWSPTERQAVQDNLLLVSLIGADVRLTTIERGQYRGSGAAEKIVAMLQAFNLKDGLVMLDHIQGFASGDLNVSETATSICREANKIVEATGAAVVFAAHISKANIGATELGQGFAVGSLAFENATRQMVGLLPMSEDAAKKFGVEATRKDYLWLGVPKNSYGGTDDGMWLKKELVKKYHTVVVKPVQLLAPVSVAKKSSNEKLADRIIDYLTRHPWTTRNQLDGVAGADDVLQASKGKVRDVLAGLVDAGDVEYHPVTDAERAQHGLAKQVKTVLAVKSGVKPAAMPAKPVDNKTSPAGLKPKLDVP